MALKILSKSLFSSSLVKWLAINARAAYFNFDLPYSLKDKKKKEFTYTEVPEFFQGSFAKVFVDFNGAKLPDPLML